MRFAALDPATLEAALADPTGLLTQVLTYHVVRQHASPPRPLAGTHTTLQGSDLTVEGMGDAYTVNGTANIICGNIQTANATVYLIDGVAAAAGTAEPPWPPWLAPSGAACSAVPADGAGSFAEHGTAAGRHGRVHQPAPVHAGHRGHGRRPGRHPRTRLRPSPSSRP